MIIYNHIAQLFNYPEGDYSPTVDKLYTLLKEYGSSKVEEFLPVAAHFTKHSTSELQEYYIRTFDVNASCYLDVGYVLFGEESKRGQFLLNMKNEQLKVNNNCGTEFPDHLPNVLTLLPKIEDNAFREELVICMILPALRHMSENFNKEENNYRYLFKILIELLETDFNNPAFKPYQINQTEIECAGAYSCGMDFTKLKGKKH